MKTHCLNGHERTEENTFFRKDGRKECKICRRLYDKKRYPGEREQRIENAAKWAKENPEAFRAIQRRQDQRPEVKARRSKFYQENKNEIWRRYAGFKGAAKYYKKDFEISKEEYEQLVHNNACFYCSSTLPVVGYGIDRLNNLIGYVHGNCVPCCERCNEKKGSLEGLGFIYPRTVELLMELLGK